MHLERRDTIETMIITFVVTQFYIWAALSPVIMNYESTLMK